MSNRRWQGGRTRKRTLRSTSEPKSGTPNRGNQHVHMLTYENSRARTRRFDNCTSGGMAPWGMHPGALKGHLDFWKEQRADRLLQYAESSMQRADMSTIWHALGRRPCEFFIVFASQKWFSNDYAKIQISWNNWCSDFLLCRGSPNMYAVIVCCATNLFCSCVLRLLPSENDFQMIMQKFKFREIIYAMISCCAADPR